MLFRTLIPENQWPALFPDQGAQLMATAYQLELSQWWSPQEMRQAQARQAQILLRHAQTHVPHYRQALQGLDFSGDAERLWEVWPQLPILDRAAANRAGTKLFSTFLPEHHGKAWQFSTSGSTGTPMRALATEVTRHMNKAMNLREHFWHQRDPMARSVSIRPDRPRSMSGVEQDRWINPLDHITPTGPSANLHSSEPIDKQVDWLLEQQPQILLSMPSSLKAIAETFRERGQTLPGLVEIRCYAETLTPEIRNLLKQVFGARVTDVYSAAETGYMTLQCPEHEHHHAMSESLVFEVLDEQGQPCAPGEVGRVVVTTLHNFASPLVRYQVGDYAEAGADCPCGRGLPTITRILGRERNLMTLPDGSRRWPLVAAENWAGLAPISQFQLVQKTLRDIEIRLVADRQLKASEKQQVEKVLNEQLQHTFDYSYSYHDSLARGRRGKFEDFISELGPSA